MVEARIVNGADLAKLIAERNKAAHERDQYKDQLDDARQRAKVLADELIATRRRLEEVTAQLARAEHHECPEHPDPVGCHAAALHFEAELTKERVKARKENDQ